ncbi:MAG: LruC domain-containing protein [Bacteroidales bacterium]|nr:LruC domain-containing protein [Bacteroidales bacterium]
MKKFIILLIALIVTSTIGCKKDDPDPNGQLSMEDLVISPSFDFNNSLEYNVKVTLPKSVDYSIIRKRINFYDAPVENGGKLLFSGTSNDNGVFIGKLKIPAYLTEIYISSWAGSILYPLNNAVKSTFNIVEDSINPNFGTGYDTIPPPDSTAVEKSRFFNSFQASTWHAKSGNSFNNMITNGSFDDNVFETVPYWSSPLANPTVWNMDQTIAPYSGQYNDGGNNTFRNSYQGYSGYYYLYGGCEQAINVNPGDLITFNADIKSVPYQSNSYVYAYIYLIPFKQNGNPISYTCYRYYNPTENWVQKTVTVTMPSNAVTCRVLMWFNNRYSELFYDNIVVTGPTNDSDGDGVDDDEDDYPDDATRAYDVYYPNEDTYGTLAFEDNWPGLGDYDFNDLILDYNFHEVLNADNEVVDIYGKYSPRAAGASFINGFGFDMNAEPDDIASVSGLSLNSDLIILNANNTEAGQEKATIILFNDVFYLLPQSGGIGTNTNPNEPYVEPDTLTLTIHFDNPVLSSTLGTPPYNPFLFVNGERGREIHLPDHPPTSLADVSLFGTGADNSIPAEGRYYKTVTNLPWAMDNPEPFDYPIEKVQIINAYNYFASWAESAGSIHADWYFDDAGYRNDANVYEKPE